MNEFRKLINARVALNKEIIDEFRLDIIKVCVKHKLVPKLVLRDELIRKEFYDLRNKGKPLKEVFPELAEKHCLGEKSIDRIVYQTYKKKRFPL